MFSGTLSDMRQAYQAFDDGLDDPCCSDCATNRELIFLHALTATAMLAVQDNGGDVSSALEIARLFGVEVVGDLFDEVDYTYVTNQHDYYYVPAGAPDANDFFDIIDTSMIPEIEAIIADLNSIEDWPEDRFRIWFEPIETGLENSIEVDYGEVLILKGGLSLLKGFL